MRQDPSSKGRLCMLCAPHPCTPRPIVPMQRIHTRFHLLLHHEVARDEVLNDRLAAVVSVLLCVTTAEAQISVPPTTLRKP